MHNVKGMVVVGGVDSDPYNLSYQKAEIIKVKIG